MDSRTVAQLDAETLELAHRWHLAEAKLNYEDVLGIVLRIDILLDARLYYTGQGRHRAA